MYYQHSTTPPKQKHIKQIFLLLFYPCAINAAYFFPLCYGILTILWIPFFIFLSQISISKKIISLTFFFAIHFLWLLHLFIEKTSLNSIEVALLYAIPIAAYTTYTILWTIPITLFNQRFMLNAILTSSIFFYFLSIQRWGGILSTAFIGYPLLHPGLPIAHFFSPLSTSHSSYIFKTIRPENKTIESLFHALEKKQKKKSTQTPTIFVTPETALEIDLLKNASRLEHCYQLLNEKDILIIGAIKEDSMQISHALYIYTKKGLEGICGKKTLIPFYEYPPKKLYRYPKLAHMFLNTNEAFTSNQKYSNVITLNQLVIQTHICADFFVQKRIADSEAKLEIIIANDSAMLAYAAELMKRYVLLSCFDTQIPLFYVGWQNNLKIL